MTLDDTRVAALIREGGCTEMTEDDDILRNWPGTVHAVRAAYSLGASSVNVAEERRLAAYEALTKVAALTSVQHHNVDIAILNHRDREYTPPKPEGVREVETTDDIGSTIRVRYDDGWYCVGDRRGAKHADLGKLIRAYSLDPTDDQMAKMLSLPPRAEP